MERRQISDPAIRAAEADRRKSTALGYPTDDQGLVALPAFTLSSNK